MDVINSWLKTTLQNKFNINDFSQDAIIIISLNPLELYYLYLDIYREYKVLIPVHEYNVFESYKRLENYLNNIANLKGGEINEEVIKT